MTAPRDRTVVDEVVDSLGGAVGLLWDFFSSIPDAAPADGDDDDDAIETEGEGV